MNLTTQYLQSDAAEANIDMEYLANCLLADAIQAGASDLHIEPWESSIAVRIRLNGVLTELVHLPLDIMDRLSGRFKVIADMVTHQVGIPHEGQATTGPELGGVELRISVFPTTRGEKIVVRIFDPRNRNFVLEELGIDPGTLERFKELLARPSGLILLNGPTGSGKTTAIYSSLAHIVRRLGPAVSVSTVEDPVEVNLPMISQTKSGRSRDLLMPGRCARSCARILKSSWSAKFGIRKPPPSRSRPD